ncbi:MAG: PrsW family glutamic-type intramembrane protease [Bacteroidetes bacterium]|jgi:protease PrsW|nr:PrsW family glutamic-type intramembrane protease [Bacteroidota bacterium]
MNLILAILPPLLIAYYIYKKDKYDVEPKKLIIKSFLFGCLAIIPAIFLEIFAEGIFTNLFLFVFFGIALVEEGVKYFFLKKYLFNKTDFNEPMDGIVYAVMISLGFATVENIAYVFNNEGEEFFTAVIRMFTAIPLHAVCGVLLGYFVGLAKFSDNSKPLLYKGLFIATLVHGLYNYFIFLGQGFIFSIIALVVAIYYSKKAINLHQQDSQIRNTENAEE